MHDPPPAGVSGFVRRLADDHTPDADLLSRYAATRDDGAFAALVKRHGPAVWRVCRGLARQPADADDAYQATFLLLVRNAGRVRNPHAVGAWLYGTAVKVASRARARRRPQPLEVEPAALDDLTVREAEALFHEELAALPDRLRDPLVLCCLEALSRDEAAKQLGVSLAAVKRGLERGREVLRARLLKRGVAVSVPLLAGLLSPHTAAAPAASVNAVSAGAVSLANEVSHMATVTKWKLVAAVGLAAVTLGGFGAAVVFGQPATAAKPARPADPPAAKAKSDEKKPAEKPRPAWEVGAEFVQLALDGKIADAHKLCAPNSMSEKKVAEVMTASGLKSARFTVMLVSDGRVELVSELATVTVKRDETAEGHVVFTLEPNPKTGVWEVKDADFADGKKVAGKLDRYLEGKVKNRPATANNK